MPRSRSWRATIAARAWAGSPPGPVIAAKIRRNDRAPSARAQDGDGEAATDGAAVGDAALDGDGDGAADADGAAEVDADGAAAADPDGAADPEADGEALGAAVSEGTGDGVGIGVRNPPCPPNSPYRRIPTKITTVAITK